MTDLEILAKYMELEQVDVDGRKAFCIKTFFCWEEDFDPKRVPHQLYQLAETYKERSNKDDLDIDDHIMQLAILKTVLMKGS